MRVPRQWTACSAGAASPHSEGAGRAVVEPDQAFGRRRARLVELTPFMREIASMALNKDLAEPTLFGEWALVREWGRRGSPGTVRLSSYQRRNEAETAEQPTIKRRLQHGYGDAVGGGAVARPSLGSPLNG